jgi:hypothetical protein
MLGPRAIPVPASIDEIRAAVRLGRELFGDRFNLFYDVGLWHMGRFLDNLPPIQAKGPDKLAPFRRRQEVFAVAPSLTEVIAVFKGPKRVYSVPGVTPGQTRGFRVRFDKHGRVRGYVSPAGIFTRRFPGEPGQWS